MKIFSENEEIYVFGQIIIQTKRKLKTITDCKIRKVENNTRFGEIYNILIKRKRVFALFRQNLNITSTSTTAKAG